MSGRPSQYKLETSAYAALDPAIMGRMPYFQRGQRGQENA